MRYRLAILIALSFVSLSAHQSQSKEPDTLIVTATRNPAPISTIGSSVSVLTAEDLRNLSVPYVDDALRTLPGVTVTQNGGAGGFSAVRIRGEESYRTLTLLDGIRIDDPAGTQIATNFANLLVANVGQIELVRGPQSLLYGADAIGGVIQILTGRPQDGFTYAGEASGGSYGTFAASGALGYGTESFGVSLSAARQHTDGFSAKTGDPDLADPDGHTVTSLHGVLRGDPSESLSLESVVHYTDAEAEFDGASAFPPFSPADPNRVLETQEIDGRVAAKLKSWDDSVTTELAYSVMSSRRNDLSNGLPFVFGARFDGERQEASLISTIRLVPAHALLFGVSRMDVSARTDSFELDGADTGVFGEWEGAFAEQLYLTAGLRYDEDEDFGGHLSGRATAAWLAEVIEDETTKLHASYGTGFRAPSPFERATNLAPGLADLKEEQSRGFDAGISQSLLGQAVLVDVTYFEQEIEDEIRFDNVGFTGYFQATGQALSRGVEVSGHGRFPVDLGYLTAIEVDSAYTYTDSKVSSPDAENGMARIRRPRHLSATTLSLDFGAERAAIALTLRTAAKTEDGFSSFRVPLDSYAVVDVSARLRITSNIEAFVRGANVLGEQYEEVDGFATSDAAVFVGLRIRT